MGEESNLEIKIRTDYDGTGTQAAKDDVGTLGDATQTAGVSVGKMADSGKQLEETGEKLGYHTLREAAHAAHGVEVAAEGGHMSLLRMAMSARALYELLVLNPFTAIATAIGVVVIALGTWIKKSAEAREAIHEDLKKLEEENAATQKKIADDAAQAHFDGLKAELDEIIERYDRLNAAEEKKLALDRAMGDAALGVKLAELDTAEQGDLKGAKGDPVKEAQIRESYAKQRLEAKHQNESANAEAAYNAAAREKQRRFNEQKQLEATREKLGEKTPAREEYEQGLRQTGEAAQKVGLKSKEETQLEELEKLRNRQAELEDQGLALGHNDTLKMFDLSSKEKELRTKAKEAPEYEDREKETARERESELPAWEKRLKEHKAFAVENPSLANTEGYKEQLSGIENQLAKAQAAKQFRAAQAQLKDQKDRAEKSEADNAKLLGKNKEDLAKIGDAQTAADEKEQLAGVKWKETIAKQKAESGKTLDAAAKDVAEKKFEQEQKIRQAEINNAEEAAKAAKGKPGEEEAWNKLGELRKAAIGRRADGAEPTEAQALLEKSERGKIDEGTREKLAAIREAREREEERQRQEREKERKAWEKAGGLETEASVEHLVGRDGGEGDVQRFTRGKFGPAVEQLNATAKNLQKNHSGDALDIVVEALRNVNQSLGMIGQEGAHKEIAALRREADETKRQLQKMEGWIKNLR